MRKRKYFGRLLAGMLLVAGLVVLQGQAANADDLAVIRQRGTLLVGVKADYPPFGFRAPSGELVGIEPTLAADVAMSLGVKLELVPVTAANRIEMLEQGKIDVIIATMNGTMERRRMVEIVKPSYYAAGFNVMLPTAANLGSWAELKGKSVCGIEGAYYNYEATTNFRLQIIPFPGTTEALAALQQQQCAGLLYDDAAIEGLLSDPAWHDYAMPLPSQEVQPWGLAVRKEQRAWAEYLSGLVKKWTKAGTIVALEEQYHIRHSKFAEDEHQKALGK